MASSIYIYDRKKKRVIEKNILSNVGRYINKKNYSVWVDIQGPRRADFEAVKPIFKIHKVTIEDCRQKKSLPKFEEFDNYAFLVFRRAFYDKEKSKLDTREFNFLIGSNFLITVHREPSEDIKALKKKIGLDNRIMGNGLEYMLYNLLDAFVDDYLNIIDEWDIELEKLEKRLISGDANNHIIDRITNYKSNILYFRKVIMPQRELINKVLRGDSQFFDKKALIYFRDTYDDLMRVYLSLEYNREIIANIFEIYMSVISNKMNEIMKILTIIATIFIPLTFVTGLYGMNFKVMPEIYWPYGYAFAWGIMILIAVIMLAYFRKKKWI